LKKENEEVSKNEEQISDKISNNRKKTKPRKKIIIIGIIIGVIFICLIALAVFGSILNSTPEGKATSTARAQSKLTTESQETEVAAINQTEEAKPTATSTKTRTEAPTSTKKPTSTPEPTPTVNPYLISIGTYLVGTDIEPGIYYGTAGVNIFDSCYWARLNSLSGGLDSIIANENAIGQYYVEVKETDYAFETVCKLTKIEGVPEPTEFMRELEAGTYLVGRDIEPGLYKGEAGEEITESCYWARLSGVSGGIGTIIANNNATGQFFIQVSSSDFALQVACPVSYQEE